MIKHDLPCLEYNKTDKVPGSISILDRENSLLIINLEKPNDYCGEFIDSERVSISLDSVRAIEDIEIKFSRSDVHINDNIVFPEGVMGKATFLDGNEDIKIKEVIESNSSMDIVHISFAANSKDEIIHINIANGIILDCISIRL